MGGINIPLDFSWAFPCNQVALRFIESNSLLGSTLHCLLSSGCLLLSNCVLGHCSLLLIVCYWKELVGITTLFLFYTKWFLVVKSRWLCNKWQFGQSQLSWDIIELELYLDISTQKWSFKMGYKQGRALRDWDYAFWSSEMYRNNWSYQKVKWESCIQPGVLQSLFSHQF